jgi:8-oxo-dGTP pyrophosphatase MutT (NUDIX family)
MNNIFGQLHTEEEEDNIIIPEIEPEQRKFTRNISEFYKPRIMEIKTIYCTNCGRYGHEYNYCREPVISVGIILVKLDNKVNIDNTNNITVNNIGINIETIHDIEIFSKLSKNIQFLVIKRKHTLGYTEFIRGRYNTDDSDKIINLFQQMTKEEIEKISKYNISDLWDEYWMDANKKNVYSKEFNRSKKKISILSNPNETNIPLNYYTKHIIPKWQQSEWGFPKGRRNNIETNFDCAVREFEEETNLTKEDYKIFENINPLIEDFIGTNGIRYKHIYYIAQSLNDKIPVLDKSNIEQISEIGDIKYYSYDDLIKIIRPYHIERKKIITKLYMFFLEQCINTARKEINRNHYNN